MKRCPTCKRTYADDGFTFCLDDGALLSAPYNPQSDHSTDEIRRPTPKTEILPGAQNSTVPANLPQVKSSDTPEVPTLTVSNPPALAAPRSTSPVFTPPMMAVAARKTRLRVLFIAAPLLLIGLILGGIFLYESRCPTLTLYCSAADNSVGCVTSGLTPWPHFFVSRSAEWQASSGELRRADGEGAVFDTTGFAGKQITVTATYRTWRCTTRVSKSFLAQ